MSTLPLAKWLNKELSELLECEVGDEYSKNILTIETESEVKEFIGSLLDLSITKNKKFLDELLARLKKPAEVPDVTVYIKPKLEDSTKSKFNKKDSKSPNESTDSSSNSISKYREDTAKKQKFSLQPTDKSNKKAADRHLCECQASRHKLIGNCLNCGRIVCEQEGSGPCYFCGNLVCRREELEKINSGSNKGQQLKAELMSRTWKGFDIIAQDLDVTSVRITDEAVASDDKLKKAVEHKNKLIDFDRSSAKRTQVIDDESDYFNTNSKWLNQKQRALLEQKELEMNDKRFNKLNNKSYTFDFAGRQVVDEKIQVSGKLYQAEIESILKSDDQQPISNENSNNLFNKDFGDITLTYIDQKSKKSDKKTPKNEDENLKKKLVYRLQDQELQEMKDDGMCLSMHQPWASLLVNGIKKHEGRGWYTPYRGRLWIHAGSKQPDQADIKEVENFYRAYYEDTSLQFPSVYPTSCLLGYVDLVDCLSSDTYKEKFPKGESDSEFVFICSNPRELVVKIPMSGQHKIFKVEKSIHQTAKKTSVMAYDMD